MLYRRLLIGMLLSLYCVGVMMGRVMVGLIGLFLFLMFLPIRFPRGRILGSLQIKLVELQASIFYPETHTLAARTLGFTFLPLVPAT